ncbi:MAG: hypothetical protein L0Z50_27040 [Verrucomicrobiales bacterium]|nr:hypothetical protein [Verrucomicrobiales bacterium]
MTGGAAHYGKGSLDLQEVNKIIALLFTFCLFAPLLGIFLKGRPMWQAGVFALVCFMSIGGIYKPQEWGFTLGFVDFYRGHTKGYPFYYVEALALALVIGRALEGWTDFRLMPPGLWLYLAYVGLSFISIVNAPDPNFVCMAAVRTVKIGIIFIAAYNFFRTPEHLQFFLVALSLTMFCEMLAVLRLKYRLHVYQVAGTFEHQNSLSMFATMAGMVFLSVSLGPKIRFANLYLLAYLACAVIEQATLSRAGLVIFAAGTAGVALLSLWDRLTRRRVVLLGALSSVAVVGLALSLDTIIGRFQDYGNEASVMTRKLLNRASRNMAADYPLGVGWNNYAIMINQPYPYGRVIDAWEGQDSTVRVDETHQKGIAESLYYLLLAETGWQGLISYLLFIVVFLWWNVRSVWRFRGDVLGAFSIGLLAGFGCNYLHSTLERVLTQPRNMALWMLLLAATARIETWRRASGNELVEQLSQPEYQPIEGPREPSLADQSGEVGGSQPRPIIGSIRPDTCVVSYA